MHRAAGVGQDLVNRGTSYSAARLDDALDDCAPGLRSVYENAGRLYLDLAGPYLAHHRSRLRVQTAQGGERQDCVPFADHTTAFVHELEAFAGSIRTGAAPLSHALGAAQDIARLQSLAARAGLQHGLAVGGEAGRRTVSVPWMVHQ